MCVHVSVLNLADAGGECECELRMIHCDDGVWGSYLSVLFMPCSCAVLCLSRMWCLRSVSAGGRDE